MSLAPARRWSDVAWAALRIAVGALFIYAGALKTIDPAAFARAIARYQLVGHELAAAVALYLPWLEIVSGFGLILRRLATAAVAVLLMLLLIFIAALAWAWARGLNVDCGCFGESIPTGGYAWAIGRDVLLVVALVMLSTKHAPSARPS